MVPHEVGKLLFAGFDGTIFTEDSQAAKLIKDYHVHCFILQPHNFISIQQLKNLINNLQSFAYSLNYPTPLVIAADFEMYNCCCGINNNEITRFPSPLALAATGKISSIYKIGQALALELRNIGFNMFFGPTLDISPKMRLHSGTVNVFGVSVEEVIRYGGAFGLGLKNGGMLTSAINFPGIGKTFVDTISECPVILDDLEQIKTRNSQPFKILMEYGILDSVKASIVSAPDALTGDTHLCLNPDIIDVLLRKDLKFDKMVISDCLEVKDVILTYGIGQAACMAILYSHCDMVSVFQKFEYQTEALEFLSKAFETDSYQALLVTAFRRVDEFLNKLSWLDTKTEMNDEIKQSHRELSAQAYSASITLVRNTYDLIPINKYLDHINVNNSYIVPEKNVFFREKRILFLVPTMTYAYDRLREGLEFYASGDGCTVDYYQYDKRGITNTLNLLIEKSSMVLFACNDLFTNAYQIDMIKKMSANSNIFGNHLITLVVDAPYALVNDDNIARTLICTYDDSVDVLHHLPAILFGMKRGTGKLPGYYIKLPRKEDIILELSNTISTNEKWNGDFSFTKPRSNKNVLSTESTGLQFDYSMFNNVDHILGFDDAALNFDPNSSNFIDYSKSTSGMSTNGAFDSITTSSANIEDNKVPPTNASQTSLNEDNFLMVEKPWVVEDFDCVRDISAITMIRLNTINDVYFPVDKNLLCRFYSFFTSNKDSQKLFVVRNSTIGTIYGVVITYVDEFDKCGWVVHIVVAKNKRRQGVGEILHHRAIQYLTIERGCTTVGLGGSFPFFNYMTPKLLDEISSIWHYLETKDKSKINIKDKSLELVSFYRALGWDYTRHRKGVFQQTRRFLMNLKLHNWVFPGENVPLPSVGISNSYDFINMLKNMNANYFVSDEADQAFQICQYMSKAKLVQDDEEVSFTKMYAEARKIIKQEIEEFTTENKKRNTFIVYTAIDNIISGACIVYTSNSILSNYYPHIDQLKSDTLDVVAGITGLFVGQLPSADDNKPLTQHYMGKTIVIPPSPAFGLKEKRLIKLSLISTSVSIIHDLGLQTVMIHNVSKEELDVLETCGFQKHLEYFTCFGKKKAFEWIV